MHINTETVTSSSDPKLVDSYRFLDRVTSKVVRSWIELEAPEDIPWAPLSRPVAECTVALITSAGLALETDRPFDQERERRNPWWGDPSYRVLPRTTRGEDVRLYHLHIDSRLAEEDVNTLFPLQRLLELETHGEIGAAAARHYSFMGYALQPRNLLEKSAPAMIRHMRHDGVNVVVLLPG